MATEPNVAPQLEPQQAILRILNAQARGYVMPPVQVAVGERHFELRVTSRRRLDFVSVAAPGAYRIRGGISVSWHCARDNGDAYIVGCYHPRRAGTNSNTTELRRQYSNTREFLFVVAIASAKIVTDRMTKRRRRVR